MIHDLLQSLSSVYLAGRLELLEDRQREYAEVLFLDWLATTRAREVWSLVFRRQIEAWPEGFPAWIDGQLRSRSPRDASPGAVAERAPARVTQPATATEPSKPV